jgi:bacterioferritin-associated ferredoxin
MIVCICRAKTDRDVLEAIEAGASSLRDLQRCGIGTDCGSCHNMLQVMIQAAATEPALVRPYFSLPLSAEQTQ